MREHAEVSTETSFRGQKGPVLYEPDGLNAPTALLPGVEDITLNTGKPKDTHTFKKQIFSPRYLKNIFSNSFWAKKFLAQYFEQGFYYHTYLLII